MSTQAEAVSVAPARIEKPSATLLIGLSLGYFMVLLDTTIVAVALPAISGSLHVGLSGLQWVTNGYTITFAALLLTAGWLSDRLGGRRVFVCGLVAFGVLSGVCAAADSLGALVALRLALGAAGALMLPASLAVITHAYSDPADRARAVGNWAAITGVALAAGPLVGGALTDTVGWRAIFLINVPLALISLVITLRLAPETPRKQRSGLDVTGQLSAVVTLGALSYALIEGPDTGWGSGAVVGAFVLTALAAAVFVAAESRAKDAAMLPLRMFRSRGFSTALGVGLIANFGLSGLLFVLSLFFQEGRHYSSLSAGLAFLPLTLPTAFNPIYTGRLVGRIGPRRPATLGFALMGIGALLQAPFTDDSALALGVTVVGLLAFGFGVSFALPALVAGMASSVPPDLAGIGAGALNSARQVGALLGVAVLGVALNLSSTNADGTKWALVVGGVSLLFGAVVAGTGLKGRTAG
ncbi:MFS transporter [Streptomyces spectabilis]|uniref:DHA2 family efflux MFS transporter permease subunit n=1 Tax=Streptomyces spectabilis TaxID=68270 RepID=A0A5P2XI24_STRST|nr:MFS transporter [Streptomyces spectabilis]MBB5105256.1 DHA2 family methylenomycin A resistance protein-like MFS transporter [Streptomyces spectabilis]MCI3906450.1 MFS transporter [Streptomyces spectabilis]QEV63294.1 DHA2 family efflux MFS transporter permease subunit [Streptomyces spectabilis]GGV51548.1 MFS transporter [Streptomyces spectabilis]